MTILVKTMATLMKMIAMLMRKMAMLIRMMAMLMTSRQCLGIAGEEGGESRGGGNWSTEFDLLSL